MRIKNDNGYSMSVECHDWTDCDLFTPKTKEK